MHLLLVKMGRHKDRKELQGKRGPGRKSKKQGDPKLPSALSDQSSSSPLGVLKMKYGGHFKQRAKKREAKKAAVKALQLEHARRKSEKKKRKEASEAAVEAVSAPLFTDDNQDWLKPVEGKKTKKSKRKETDHQEDTKLTKKKIESRKQDLLEGGSDGNGSEDGMIDT